ncbi:MAG: hypothetical protein R6W75_05485 [Smithellaceae bacterium]
MRTSSAFKTLLLVLTVSVCLAGCGASGTKILIKNDQYKPAFNAGEFNRYKGKKAVLSNFHNQAGNTTNWGYSSGDKKFYYEGNEKLESYLAGCFRKSFRHVGVQLVDYIHDPSYAVRYWWGVAGYRAPKGVPEFQLVLMSLTDEEFKFKVLVFRDGETRLNKEMRVTMSPVATTDVASLEQRSYRLVDHAFVAILRDRDFQRVF